MKYLLLLVLAIPACTHHRSPRGERRCVEIYTKEFGQAVCDHYSSNGAGCFGYDCDVQSIYSKSVTIRCDGNALIDEDVDCP